MNKKIKELLLKLGFHYRFLPGDNHHVFEDGNYIITFDGTYEVIAIDNGVAEYTIDYDDLNREEEIE